jgi:hypothetical protein
MIDMLTGRFPDIVGHLLFYDDFHQKHGIEPHDFKTLGKQRSQLTLYHHAVEAMKLCFEDITLIGIQSSVVLLIEMLQHTAEQEKEQLLFVSEILVEAASGNPCAGYDFIDGCIGEGNAGKLLPCRIQKPVLLLFGKAKECFRTHGESSLSINDSLSYDRLSLIIAERKTMSILIEEKIN